MCKCVLCGCLISVTNSLLRHAWPIKFYLVQFNTKCRLHQIPTSPGRCTSRGLAVGGSRCVTARLTQSSTEMFIHHRTNVPLEIREKHTSGADVLSLRWVIFLPGAVLLFYGWPREVRKRRAASANCFWRFLHFRVKCQFLGEKKLKSICMIQKYTQTHTLFIHRQI